MPFDDMPPKEVRGRYRKTRERQTRSVSLMPFDDMPPKEVRGRYRWTGGCYGI